MGAYAVLSVTKIKELFKNSSVIAESLYSWEEYLEMKKEFGDAFRVLAVFSSPDIRAERIAKRPFRPLTKEEFILREYSQIENLHQAGPIARADFFVLNEGTKDNLNRKIDEIISRF